MLPVHDIDVPPAELRFHRSSGRISLDLIATIGERWRARFERLRGPDDLRRWLAGVGLAPDTAPTADDLAAARRLRGAVELLAVAAMAGEPYPDRPVEIVNADAASDGGHPQLVGRRAELQIRETADALAVVARDAVDLFGSDTADRVRECGADDCALVFLDTSRSRNRRWCSMRACGNRRKAARHRARSSAAGPGPDAGTRQEQQA